MTRLPDADGGLRVRLLTHVPGRALAGFSPHDGPLLGQLGRLLGQLDGVLQGIDHPAARQRDLPWNLQHARGVLARGSSVFAATSPQGAAIEHFAAVLDVLAPRLAGLPLALIHGDANDHNVVVAVAGPQGAPRLGLIDFGDLVWSYRVGEVAVAGAYAMLDQPDPLDALCHLLAGYQAAAPLTELEVELLFPLACARLCMSAVFAAEQHRAAPDNDYLLISQRAVQELLPRLRAVHPRLAEYALRRACGWPPDPQSKRLRTWLQRHAVDAAGVLQADLAAEPCRVLDLSVGSAELGGLDADLDGDADVEDLTEHVFGAMRRAGARIGIGRYDEARLLYGGEHFAVPGVVDERRTVHLGIDLFAYAGTSVAAPFAGVVHGAACNEGPLDYGPTVVLEHRVADDLTFYSLYGHLSADSLAGLEVGQSIARGEVFARIGAPPENGNWPPHLHFQLISDMLGKRADYPGVAAPRERQLWLDLCPDPAEVLHVAEHLARFEDARARSGEIRELRERHLSSALSLSYDRPLHIVRGRGVSLFDTDGRAYLDCVNNVCHVGHCHPHVVGALQRQAAVLNTNTRYLHENIVRYAERLTALLPSSLSVCFFVNSGSEANELALRLAWAHAARPSGNGAHRGVIVLEGAYHGHSSALIDLSPYKHDGPGGRGAPDWVQVAAMPDAYRGLHRGGDPAELGPRYAAHVAECVERAAARGGGPAAFLAESILSCGGQIVLPEGYLREVYAGVRAAGGVCIADEVQVGLGRVGSHFSAFETQGVVPDILTLGKPIGNGHPLAAVVTTEAIAASFANGMEYFNTFGGNPVSCAVGLAVLDVLADEGLQQNAAEVGAHLLAELRTLQERFPLLGDVRGLGLFLGLELVTDRHARTPAPRHAARLVERMRDHGVLLSTDGPQHNVIKIKPPLVFSRRDADRLVATLASVLAETAMA